MSLNTNAIALRQYLLDEDGGIQQFRRTQKDMLFKHGEPVGVMSKKELREFQTRFPNHFKRDKMEVHKVWILKPIKKDK